jgi:SAM-dependent methyltransferase
MDGAHAMSQKRGAPTVRGVPSFYAGVFLVTAATLMLQVVQTRILSVVAWYHLAFFVISIAMFGLTAGAVWVYLRRERFTGATLSYDLAHFSVAFALTTAIAVIVQMCLAPVTALSLTAVASWAILALCLALPFFFSGVTISLALTRSPFPVGRVYGIDMAGAAAGCLGGLVLLNATNGPAAVLWISVVAVVAARLFAAAGIGQQPPTPWPLAPALQRRDALLALLALLALANSITDHGLSPLYVKGKIEALQARPIFQAWNSFSRVAMFERGKREPHLWGPGRAFAGDRWRVPQRLMNIDGDAGTVAFGVRGDLAKAAFLKYDITNLAYYLPGHHRAAVIGVGGGRDLLSARVFGVPEVIGVEINPIFVRLLTELDDYADYVGLRNLAGISFVVDEARSWFARSRESFDIIQMSLIDTWAATGAGAFTLSENGLYTVEAWRIFLQRLSPGGVFTVSRWHAAGEVNETGRMVSLAVATLFDLGVAAPARHVFLATSGRIATLIVAKEPLTPAMIDRLRGATEELGFDVLISPDEPPRSPVLREIVNSASRAQLEAYTAGLPRDLTPADDERPFFFNQLPLQRPLQTLQIALHPLREGINSGNVLATATLGLLFLVALLLVLATIVIPLRPALRDVGARLAVGGTLYFALIGIGFMCVEIGLLQRLSVFLGHPVYALSIVLFAIILTTGLGSLLSDRLPLDTPRRLAAWSLLAGGYLIHLPLWLPQLTLAFDGEVLLLRALLGALIIAPGGVLIGWGFPTGMRLIAALDATPTPWFWGINGAAGVLASALAVAVSIAFGISTTLVIGAVCYWLLMPAALIIGFRPTRPASDQLPDSLALDRA